MPITNGRSGPRSVALGLKYYLKQFAARHRASTWEELAEGDTANWKYYILLALNDPETTVFFQFPGSERRLRAASGRATPTDWELLMIYQNPGWWGRIRWFDGDSSASNPFDLVS